MLTQHDHVDQATTFIEELKERVEVLKRRKDEVVAQIIGDDSKKSISTTTCTIKVRELDSTLEVILTSGLQKNFTLQEVIKIIEEKGTQVVSTNYYYSDAHSIYATLFSSRSKKNNITKNLLLPI